MYLTKRLKKRFAKHGEKHTGKSEAQIALFTSELSPNRTLEKNRHDYNTERSLVLLVERRSLLDYLKRKKSTDIVRLSKHWVLENNIQKRRASAPLFYIRKKKKFGFHWVLGINYANNNYNTTRTHV
jgi:small subunit ribosomal protein S15